MLIYYSQVIYLEKLRLELLRFSAHNSLDQKQTTSSSLLLSLWEG